MSTEHRILFVCLGNICRSPTAEGVMLHLLQDRGITSVVVDSAGTSAYHVGEQADSRSQQEDLIMIIIPLKHMFQDQTPILKKKLQ